MTLFKSFFQVPTHSDTQSYALLFLRIVCGLAFMHHGYGKIQAPFTWMGPESSTPGFFQLLAAISEFGGGLAWIIGLLTPLASLGIACTMAVAVNMHSLILGDPFVANGPGQSSFEPAVVYLVVALLILAFGPGKISLDYKIFNERS